MGRQGQENLPWFPIVIVAAAVQPPAEDIGGPEGAAVNHGCLRLLVPPRPRPNGGLDGPPPLWEGDCREMIETGQWLLPWLLQL